MTDCIIRVFPRRTSHTPNDDMVFIGDPPMDRPLADEVHVSCTFTWEKPIAERLQKAWAQYYPVVKLGGPAYDPGDGFIAGMYNKQGVTYTRRGCNNQCPWCLVSIREGKHREIAIAEGNIEQSNNLLQSSRPHFDKVMDMLSKQRHVVLSGGLQSSLVNDYNADRIRSLRISQIFTACDTPEAIKPLRKALKILNIKRDKVRCYVLLKFNPNETISDATGRLIQVWEAGAMPFAMLYQPADSHIEYPQEWRQFQRTWTRPAGMRTFMKGKSL
jgi:hypothetical protein